MKTLHLESGDWAADFTQCHRLAGRLAEGLLDTPMLLSFYDRERDLESPNGVSECHQGCTTPGWVDYAVNRGGSLMIDFDHGRFVFCFMGTPL